MLDNRNGLLLSSFDETDPAYWAGIDPEAYYGAPPIPPERLEQLEKARKLTLDQRIKMRIKHGTGWHNQL